MHVEPSLIFNTSSVVLMVSLLTLMLISIWLGTKVHNLRKASREKHEGRGSIMKAMLALFGFLLAFTFGMSGSRFDARRQAIVHEANAIGTAILRADLYPDSQRVEFRKDFQEYLEARIAYQESGLDLDSVYLALDEAAAAGKRIWNRAASLSKDRDLFVASNQMVGAVNHMLDLSTTRTIGELSRVPDSVYYMLFVLALVSAFFLGYSMADTIDWMAASTFCLLIVVVIYITLDLDRPRRGFIDMSTSHQAMIELRKMF